MEFQKFAYVRAAKSGCIEHLADVNMAIWTLSKTLLTMLTASVTSVVCTQLGRPLKDCH